jgi:hypothetical protein
VSSVTGSHMSADGVASRRGGFPGRQAVTDRVYFPFAQFLERQFPQSPTDYRVRPAGDRSLARDPTVVVPAHVAVVALARTQSRTR